ncbi:MAG TPA: uracil-DNA glycosylase [Thermoanaerobaculaceae bacterium]|nr:uracil-DNA glycosylase [Thermoanaerobaculaceae bacterium]
MTTVLERAWKSERQRLPCDDVTACRACPRLVAWREAQATRVPLRFRTWVVEHGFWGRPVEAFGDPDPWLAIVGLAPAAQGANRTGRMFTGDRSGDFLYAALHRGGLASQPTSSFRGDGLVLAGVRITAAVRCAPPGNRPQREEVRRCRPFLARDLASCARPRVVLCLGRLAHDAVLAVLRAGGWEQRPPFRHGAAVAVGDGLTLVDSYHVSQQNTFTGRLTPAMLDDVLSRCHALRA